MTRRHPQKGKKKLQTASTSAGPAAPSVVRAATSHEVLDTLPRPAKLNELERQLKLTSTSTASLGKYDKKLKGEALREKGVKRQFEQNEIDARTEREKYFAVLESMEADERKKKRIEGKEIGDDGLVNARKAIRAASKGRGTVSLAGSSVSKKAAGTQPGRGGPSSLKAGASKSGAASKGKDGKTKSSLSKGKSRGK